MKKYNLIALSLMILAANSILWAQSKNDSNRGPSEEKRYWHTMEEVVIDNKTYIVKNKYTVREVAMLTDCEYIDKETNQVVQRAKKDGYKLFPTKEYVYKMPGDTLLSSNEYFGFGKPYFCPDSASMKTLMTDGSYDVSTIVYIVDIKFSNIPAPEKKPGKEVLGSWLDYM